MRTTHGPPSVPTPRSPSPTPLRCVTLIGLVLVIQNLTHEDYTDFLCLIALTLGSPFYLLGMHPGFSGIQAMLQQSTGDNPSPHRNYTKKHSHRKMPKQLKQEKHVI